MLLVVTVACVIAACEDDHEPMPELAKVPSFELTDHHGEPFTADQMDGKVWVVDFFFTSCPTYCPLLTEKMAKVRSRLQDTGPVRFLSVSVDPEHDTPEVLREYAREHEVAHADWTFVTGESKPIHEIVVEGFKVPMGEPVQKKEGEGYAIRHARHFVLVGPGRRVRGYYRTEDGKLDALVDDARYLAGKAEK